MSKEKFDIHKNLCEKSHETYVAKNADYGDSFTNVRKQFPIAILIRLHDKLSRLDTLLGNSNYKPNVDESIDDTLMDMATYCLMELTEREIDKQKNQKDIDNII